MDREMTPSEKTEYKRHFPNLDVDRARVTDDATDVYNCIAWTVDVDWDWLWPGSTINEFDVFYQGYGFVRQGSGPVAVWALNGDYNQMTHGCISGPGHGPRWESKCGAGLRIQHGLTELEGAIYGQVIAYYAKSRDSRVLDKAAMLQDEVRKSKEVGAMLLDEYQKKALDGLKEAIPKDTVEAFENRFSAWKETWKSGHRILLSNTSYVRHSNEFVELAGMGKEIMPLLIEKLVEPDNFRALHLYDALQTDKFLKVLPGSSEEVILKGERFRAEEVVKLFLSNT
ncbi:conserved hypothetical protein [Desulfatibacillum aliphaticivorans]|uniref:DUF7689 domain-containing protein n=1 Tax=Desulfatibacillum aliphaticivorans TaxID=218208 RepID=B8FB48_DESAL|nr:hypothetical protein [Desulfatibacillum aliphaticivorans]ACL04134.1 conserved hypothetical protein [Desulfatibacillum aliphaticivorans]